MKRIVFYGIIFWFAISFIHSVRAQPSGSTDEQKVSEEGRNKGWWFGLNIGAYLPNHYQANFYNGTSTNENKIGFVLDNRYRYQEIVNLLHVDNYKWQQKDLPRDMHYKPGINIGGFINYQFKENWGVFMQFNFTKLEAKDVFVMELDTHKVYVLERDRRFSYSIYGIEERVSIDLGLRKIWNISDNIQFAANFGLHLNDTEVKNSDIRIENKSFTIINPYAPGQEYIPGVELQKYDFRYGGIGVGLMVEPSVQFMFNENISVDPGITMYWNNINLPGYKKFGLNVSPFIRILVNGFI